MSSTRKHLLACLLALSLGGCRCCEGPIWSFRLSGNLAFASPSGSTSTGDAAADNFAAMAAIPGTIILFAIPFAIDVAVLPVTGTRDFYCAVVRSLEPEAAEIAGRDSAGPARAWPPSGATIGAGPPRVTPSLELPGTTMPMGWQPMFEPEGIERPAIRGSQGASSLQQFFEGSGVSRSLRAQSPATSNGRRE